MSARRLPRRTLAASVLTAAVFPLTAVAAASPAAAASKISAQSFGMHYFSTGHAYPQMTFGSGRIWDAGVTWRDLQPQRGRTSAAALARLDKLVATLQAHGVQPMITLGMTPNWAARRCPTHYNGVNWGLKTCAPTNTSATGAWGAYVRMLADRYRGKVRYFELWNEPSLHNGYNDSIARLARMQATAESILHRRGDKLVSPGVPFTDGGPNHGLRWLDSFLSQQGGRSFDIAGFHLYPMDSAARGGYGPEWAMGTLSSARSVLRRHGIGGRPVWNTETNVGRMPAHIHFTGTKAAGMVARTYVLATENGIARTFWYGADDRSWGGVWLENGDYKTLAAPGKAYVAARSLLVGATPHGCSRSTVGANRWHYTCRYHLANGKNMLAVWSTGKTFMFHGPRGTQQATNVTGGSRAASHSTALSVGSAPVYVIGTFKV